MWNIILKVLPFIPPIIEFFKRKDLSEKVSVIPDNIKEGINTIVETIKTVVNIDSKISAITKEIKSEITIGIEKVQRSIESGINSKIEQIKKDIGAEIDNKITKLRKQIIRYIILAWVIQTGVIIALLWLFSH